MLIGLLIMKGGEIRNCGEKMGATKVGVSELGATKEEEARS